MHEHYMRMALAEAEAALAENKIPVKTVIIHKNHIITATHNQRKALHNPTAHAEMIAITQAAQALGTWRLSGCSLYVTLEPCPICAGAIVQARLPQVVYGAADPKAGAVQTLYQMLADRRLNHQAQTVPGVLADQCGAMLSRFFEAQRRLGKK